MTPRKEITSSTVLIVFSLVFMAYTTRYPIDDWENPGPAVFPLLTGAFLFLLSLSQLVRGLVGRRKEGRQAEGTARLGGFFADNPAERRVAVLVAALAAYVLFIPWLGFFVSTFLMTAFAARLMGAKGWLRPMVLSGALGLFCYLLFEVWIRVPFPRGLLF